MKHSTLYTLIAIIGILCMIVIAPFLTMWALNTLFPVLAIPYTFKTWLATVLLGSAIAARKRTT